MSNGDTQDSLSPHIEEMFRKIEAQTEAANRLRTQRNPGWVFGTTRDYSKTHQPPQQPQRPIQPDDSLARPAAERLLNCYYEAFDVVKGMFTLWKKVQPRGDRNWLLSKLVRSLEEKKTMIDAMFSTETLYDGIVDLDQLTAATNVASVATTVVKEKYEAVYAAQALVDQEDVNLIDYIDNGSATETDGDRMMQSFLDAQSEYATAERDFQTAMKKLVSSMDLIKRASIAAKKQAKISQQQVEQMPTSRRSQRVTKPSAKLRDPNFFV
ncbi:unnamed protein product [Caenorhabditis sp. 36 PRJEB53466]|nr:unnamed protein product [Caenorhabditis sp. 36 PRJEB53466]